jgi:hypothetical protein
LRLSADNGGVLTRPMAVKMQNNIR